MKNNRAVILSAFLLSSAPALLGGPGDGINFPRLVLSPYADAAGVYDSNVWLSNPQTDTLDRPRDRGDKVTENPKEDDYYWRLTAGLGLRNRADSVRLAADGWFTANRYFEVNERDNDEYGERVNVGWGSRERLDVNLYQRYSLADEYDHGPRGRETLQSNESLQPFTDPTLVDRNELTRREMFDVGGKLGRTLTDKTDLDITYGYMRTDFDNEDLFTRDEHRLGAELGYRATDKTTVYIMGEGALQDSDGYDENAALWLGRIGAATRSTAKLILRASLGASYYEFKGAAEPVVLNENPDNVPTETESMVKPDAELGLDWMPAEKWTVQLRGMTGYTPANQYVGNVAFQGVLAAAVSYQYSPKWNFSLLGSVRRDDFEQEVIAPEDDDIDSFEESLGGINKADEEVYYDGGSRVIDKYIDLWSIGGMASYEMTRYLHLFGDIRRTQAFSNDPLSEYDVYQITIGVNARY